MADAAEPAGAPPGGVRTPPPAPPSEAPVPARGVSAALYPGADTSPVEPYRPLSLLAVIGFTLAALYGVFVLVCFVAAVFGGAPLLWSLGTLVIPLAAAGISLAAWLLIQNSEGTLAGQKLAVWGMFLSVLLALGYTAYYAANYLFVRNQASAFAQTFLDQLTKDEVDRAFSLTLPPENRPADDKLRDELERLYNLADTPNQRGALGQFCQSELVRFLRQGGREAKVEFTGVNNWENTGGGYTVRLNYRLTSPEGACEAQVAVVSSETRRGGATGKAWRVAWTETFVRDTPGTRTLTDKGRRMTQLRHESVLPFARGWMTKLSQGRLFDAYLDTRGPSDRDLLAACLVLTGVSAEFTPGPLGLAAVVPGYEDFRKGSFLKADPSFWPPGGGEAAKARALEALQAPPGRGQSAQVFVESASDFPYVADEANGVLRMQQNVRIDLPQKLGAAPTTLEATAVFEVDAREAAKDTPNLPWRVAGLRLLRSKEPPKNPGERQPGRQ